MTFMITASSSKETPEQKLHGQRSYHLERARQHFHEASLISEPGTRTHYGAVTGYHDSMTGKDHHHSLTPRMVSSAKRKAAKDVEKHHASLESDFPITGEEEKDRAANGAVARGHLRMAREHAKGAHLSLTPLGIE